MSFNGWLAVGAGCIFGGLTAWALYMDRRRQLSKRRRFACRQPIPLDEIYETFYENSGLERESVLRYWKEVARLLALDARRLRPGDRFAEEYGPIEGEELGDELEDLAEFL